MLPLLIGLLLLAAALRVGHLVDFLEWPDEIRTVWRAESTLENLLIRTPPDWPPTYGLLTWGWARLAGPTLEAARVLSALAGILGVALVYRAAYAWVGQVSAALLAAVIYTVAGYAIFAGVDARAYGLLLAVGAAALWLTRRWLNRPTWRRSVPVALLLALTFTLSYTSAVFIAFVTLLVLLTRPALWRRWLGVGALALLASLPVLPGFFDSILSRLSVMPQPVPPLPQAVVTIYSDFGGSVWFLYPLGLAVAVLIARAVVVRRLRGPALALVVGALFPLALYFAVGNAEYLETRYTWWVLLALILLISSAAAQLPRSLQLATVAVFVGVAAVPVDFSAYRLAVTTSPPFRETFGWFADHLRPGDVLVIDPHCTCGEPFAWDYFVPQYFPTGYLPLADEPGEVARVWYLSTQGWERDEALLAQVNDGRAESIFSGPWYFLLRLYEAPPLPAGVIFGGAVVFNGFDIAATDRVLAKNDRMDVRLWWSARQPITADYSISLALLDENGRLVAQVDRPVQVDGMDTQTSAWPPGRVYSETRTLQLPPDIPDGDYHVVLTVYQWWDGGRLTPAAHPVLSATADDYLMLMRVKVAS